MPERDTEEDREQARRPQPFWSGQIAFGLVNVPVSLFAAHRSSRVSLRMIDTDGTPLTRRYFCPREERPLASDQIVRGYEIDKDSYVVIEDEELDSIAPEKSREIDLRRFVALDEIDPVYFERAYFMVPDRKATKAYRLLAKTMEDTQRAGIATFVMRGKEHLVAIVAEQGILRAETLRFHDEIRSPEDVGLPAPERAEDERTREIEQTIGALSTDDLDRDELAGTRDRRLLEQVRRKLERGEDVMELPDFAEPSGDTEDEDDGSNVIDLMAVLKERLGQSDDAEAGAESGSDRQNGTGPEQPTSRRADARSSRRKESRRRTAEPDRRTKAELYRRARELDIPGRTRMTRDQLARAVRDAG